MGAHRLLIVDDEPNLLDLLRRYLGRLGYEVETCGDAQEALALFQAGPDRFSMAITDLSLPSLNGEELIERMRQIRPGLPADHYQWISLPAARRRRRVSAKTFPPADAGGGGRKSAQRLERRLVPAAQTRRLAHAGGTRRHGVLRVRGAVGVRGEGRELLFEMLLAAGWAVHTVAAVFRCGRRTSFSNLLPQSSHRYSKIGIGYSTDLIPQALTLFYQPRPAPRPAARKSC